MIETNDTVSDESSYTEVDLAISYQTRFWLFLISDILSFLFTCFVLFHFLFVQRLRQSINNHTTIVLLVLNIIYELTDLPLIIHYYRLDGLWQPTPIILSKFWSFFDSYIYTTQIIIFAWSTVERHILIFHDRWLAGKTKRFLFHYFPLILLLFCYLIYYTMLIFYPFCDYLNYQLLVNGVPVACIYLNSTFAPYDLIINQIIPTFIIVISSLGLLIRVILKKRRLRRVIEWKKQRKLIIQTLSISILYACFQFPWTLFQFCDLIHLSVDNGRNALKYTYFFSYYVTFLFPFVLCASVPGLWKRTTRIFRAQRLNGTVVPERLQPNELNQTK